VRVNSGAKAELVRVNSGAKAELVRVNSGSIILISLSNRDISLYVGCLLQT